MKRWLCLLLPACSVSAPASVPASASVPDSASDSDSDSGLADTGADTDADAGPEASSSSFASDPIGLYWVDVSPTTSRGLVLLSTRFTEDLAGATYHQECLAELRNDGPTTLCAIEARLSLKDGDDMERAGFVAFVEGPPFVGATSSSPSVPCLAPGDRGAFFASADVIDPVGPDTVRSVEATFTSVPSTAPRYAHAPSLDWFSAEHVAGRYYALAGIIATHATVHDVVLHAYPRVAGVLRRRLIASHPSTLADSTTWSFTTAPGDAPFTEVLSIISFTEGVR